MHQTGTGWGWVGGLVWVCAWACLWGAVLSARSVYPASAAEQRQQWTRPVCRGLHRAEVDWWVMLKHPGGYQYSYVDSSRAISSGSKSAGSCAGGFCWQHALSMENPNPVGHTLEVLATAAAADHLAYVIYNDADPGGTEHFEFAHAKGVVAFSSAAHNSSNSSSYDSAAGFWLVHSAPSFPRLPGQPDWMQLQHPQSVFGQHFSCFSLGRNSSIAAVAELLLAAGPYIYSSRLPISLAAQYPSWVLLLSGVFEHRALAISASLFSVAGLQLRAFAKSSSLNVSLTDNVVGPGLRVSMFWETWRRSHDALHSVCPAASLQVTAQHSSLNIDQVAFQGTQYRWGWQQDHSKWGVSSVVGEGAPLVVCLGDMNRAGWQAHRGGSYVCMQHSGLWQAFHGLLAAAEPCVLHS